MDTACHVLTYENSFQIALMAAGARYLVTDHISIGANYEIPVTDRRDYIDWRTHLDLIIIF